MEWYEVNGVKCMTGQSIMTTTWYIKPEGSIIKVVIEEINFAEIFR